MRKYFIRWTMTESESFAFFLTFVEYNDGSSFSLADFILF